MDYLQIVIEGYFIENNRRYLEKYFFRECKKAEKEYFEAEEFFIGCLGVVEIWNGELKKQIHERKSALYSALNAAESNRISFQELGGKTREEKRLETIEYCNKELADERENGIGSMTFKVNLLFLTNGRINYDLSYSEIISIQNAIGKAYQIIKNEQVNVAPQIHENTGKKIAAPTIAAFCGLLNESDVEKKGEVENVKDYCIRICEKYGLPYTDRVRQLFSSSRTNKNNTKLIEKIFPLLSEETKSIIQKYLDNKMSSNKKLYG